MRTLALAAVLVGLTTSLEAQSTPAPLINRGNGLIYDPNLNITWLQNADVFGTGTTAMSWDAANAAVAGLAFGGVTGWRLPTTPGSGVGYLPDGEMGFLYYNLLGNTASLALNWSFFVSVQNGRYWTATPSGDTNAFAFYVGQGAVGLAGHQDMDSKVNGNNVWAVHDGDVAAMTVTPEPAALPLVGIGALAVFAVARRRRTVVA